MPTLPPRARRRKRKTPTGMAGGRASGSSIRQVLPARMPPVKGAGALRSTAAFTWRRRMNAPPGERRGVIQSDMIYIADLAARFNRNGSRVGLHNGELSQ